MYCSLFLVCCLSPSVIGLYDKFNSIIFCRHLALILHGLIVDSSSLSSSSSLLKGVGDHVPPQLSVLCLCDNIHRSFFSCPFSDAVKNLFSWSSLRSFSQYSRRCYQVLQSLPSHGVPKSVCLLFSNFAFKCSLSILSLVCFSVHGIFISLL